MTAKRRASRRGLEKELVALPSLPITQLRSRFTELMGKPPPKSFGPDLLWKSVAHRLQEQAFGKLSNTSQHVLDRLVHEAIKGGAGALELPSRIKIGAELVRTWGGRDHRVTVVQGGFHYNGHSYGSLSEIASKITGVKWSGNRFFGLRIAARRYDHD